MDNVIDSDVGTPGFSLRTAYYLAYASKAAYEGPGDWTEELGLGDKVKLFTQGQFHGFVGFLDPVILLVLRGTQNLDNWLTDADTPLVSRAPYPGRVHLGFARAVDQVWPEVRKLLAALPKRPVWVTGHSLGGALATLAALRLVQDGYEVRGVYTYGSPRVGNRFFHSFYNQTNYRFVNNDDVVPHLPFRWCYKHVGQLELLDAQGNLIQEDAAWRAKKRALRSQAKRVQQAHRVASTRPRTLAEFEGVAGFERVTDHYIDNYLAALAKVVERLSPAAQPAQLVGEGAELVGR
jgi:triacylglycerol lipase